MDARAPVLLPLALRRISSESRRLLLYAGKETDGFPHLRQQSAGSHLFPLNADIDLKRSAADEISRETTKSVTGLVELSQLAICRI
jgi:hypothetical protein